MSVLIKGMEMPKDCQSCRFCFGYICLALKDQEAGNCPLIKLPPHGDLIDRDALTSKRKTVLTGIGSTSFTTEAVLMADIKNAPIIIPASEEGE